MSQFMDRPYNTITEAECLAMHLDVPSLWLKKKQKNQASKKIAIHSQEGITSYSGNRSTHPGFGIDLPSTIQQELHHVCVSPFGSDMQWGDSILHHEKNKQWAWQIWRCLMMVNLCLDHKNDTITLIENKQKHTWASDLGTHHIS